MKAAKVAAPPAESKPAKAKSARKTAEDFFSDDDATAAAPTKDVTKPTKSKKKGKATNGDVPVLAETVVDVAEVVEKPKKGKKSKAVTEAVIVEAPEIDVPVLVVPKQKATKAKKGKKADVAPVEEDATTGAEEVVPAKKSKKSKKKAGPVEEVAEVKVATEDVDGDEAEEDDQTAALLAGFSDDENDPEDDVNFDEGATIPAVSKSDRTALERALKGVKSNEPGVVYIGYVNLDMEPV